MSLSNVIGDVDFAQTRQMEGQDKFVLHLPTIISYMAEVVLHTALLYWIHLPTVVATNSDTASKGELRLNMPVRQPIVDTYMAAYMN